MLPILIIPLYIVWSRWISLLIFRANQELFFIYTTNILLGIELGAVDMCITKKEINNFLFISLF